MLNLLRGKTDTKKSKRGTTATEIVRPKYCGTCGKEFVYQELKKFNVYSGQEEVWSAMLTCPDWRQAHANSHIRYQLLGDDESAIWLPLDHF